MKKKYKMSAERRAYTRAYYERRLKKRWLWSPWAQKHMMISPNDQAFEYRVLPR